MRETILIDKKSDFICMVTAPGDGSEIFHLPNNVTIELNNYHDDGDNDKANKIFYRLIKDFIVVD